MSETQVCRCGRRIVTNYAGDAPKAICSGCGNSPETCICEPTLLGF